MKRSLGLLAAMFVSANLALILYGVGTPLNAVGVAVGALVWVATEVHR